MCPPAALPKEIGGEKVVYVSLDDESDPTKGAQNVRRLMAAALLKHIASTGVKTLGYIGVSPGSCQAKTALLPAPFWCTYAWNRPTSTGAGGSDPLWLCWRGKPWLAIR